MPVDRFPTEEQRAVLESRARIVVVKAGPGSGKTRVFVESLRRRLAIRTPGPRGGIAALSFTRVAQQEIANRIGAQLPAPHFVGTLDSFLLRFVVRPFAHLIGLKKDGLRLIPSPFDQNVDLPSVQLDGTPGNTVSLFALNFSGGVELQPDLTARSPITRKVVKLDAARAQRALRLKGAEWRGRGWVTHSDCHYIAASILRDHQVGAKVAALVAHRFPEILIDELQDTGWFLGRAITRLLEEPSVTGLVVGDPDQAIYEFSGATPAIFADVGRLQGAETLSLTVSHRCPEKVAAVSSMLAASRQPLNIAPGASTGRAVLLRHSSDPLILDGSLKRQVLEHCEAGDSLAILVRRGNALKRLVGHVKYDTPKGFSAVPKELYRASALLKSGESGAAIGITEACLGGFAWGSRYVTRQLLHEKGVARKTWRTAVHGVLTEITSDVDGESWNVWTARSKSAVLSALRSLGWDGEERALNQKFRNCANGSGIKSLLSPPPQIGDWACVPNFSTVHQVKGEEYDCVALFVPKPHAARSLCPSTEWWSQDAEEEKRIAFVAASRARKVFLLVVHDKTFEALRELRPEFFGLFSPGQITPGVAQSVRE